MKRNIKLKSLTFSCFCLAILNVNAQTMNVSQVNSMYFMENLPQRHDLNPAFQPYSDFYIGLPIIAYSRIGLGNPSPMLNGFVSNPSDGKNFYNSLINRTNFQLDMQVNLLSLGFRSKRDYWNFSITEKMNGQIGVPKEMFNLLLNETQNAHSYNLNDFNINMAAYTEAAVGFSREINDKWSYGGKLKFLYGNSDMLLILQNASLNAQSTGINLSAKGILNANDSSLFSLKPGGLGGAFDLGFTFKPTERLTLSGALTDLGMIHWLKKSFNKVSFSYTGTNTNFMDNISTVLDNAYYGLKHLENDSITGGYNTYTTPKLNLGAEFSFFDNKLSLGVLSRTLWLKNVMDEEVTASINGRPNNWMNLTLSYSVFNGKTSNIGAGLGLRTGFLHWFLSADYIPLDRSTIASFSTPIPYSTRGVNLGIGLTIALGNRKDADRDGVTDKLDLCPDTPKGVKVDKNGCPIDTDGDGVPDYLDKCPDTPNAAVGFVDKDGCLIDTDGDGVPDYLDKCADTPKEAIGYVGKDGCNLDSDGDGVPDYLDKCPKTPEAAKGLIDKEGCPIDSDGDGVPDYLDLCPNTPAVAKGFVDKNGCTRDSDGDGIPDFQDKCPDTPLEAHGMVDAAGCPRDTDGDGIPDYLDKCPTFPGSIKNYGCPEFKADVKPDTKLDTKPDVKPDLVPTQPSVTINKNLKVLFQKALQGIQFDPARYTLKPSSYEILDQIAEALVDNSTFHIEIQGHTDNVGNPVSNKLLSEKRAQAVLTYLVTKGVDAKRISSRGFGDTLPVASNKTPAGKMQNRRVEFVVTYDKSLEKFMQ